jgi:glyoxylase-like metal-dependent hydrolase (beta-lactamase superfamily II)
VRLRDRTLRALHRPGHSPSDTIFVDEQRQITLAGDHLLAHISSNPLLARPLDESASDGDRPHALLDYIASMRVTREMPAGLMLGGHGAPVTDHVTLIDERFRMHERRASKIHGLLKTAPAHPATVFDLANRMWGNVAVTQAMLTISEVIGHLDLLIGDGMVREDADGDVTYFSTV